MVRVGLAPDLSSLLIRFEYDPRLVELTKQLPGRRFHRRLGGWLTPLTQELVQELPSHYPGEEVQVDQGVKDRLSQLQADEQATLNLRQQDGAIALPAEMRFPTTQPFKHQRTALGLFTQRSKFAFFMEMGTGKTYVMLTGLRWLKEHQALRPALIVCPASVMDVWVEQAKQHQPDLKVVALKGSLAKRKVQLQNEWVAGTEIFVLNYEAVWRMEDELKRLPWKVVVCDESTRIKSRTTKQSKALFRLGAGAPRRYLLTGTPIPNSPLELFSQFLFLDPAIFGHHYYAFRDRYAVMGGYQGYQVVSWRNVPELMDKLAKHSYRVTKRECLDLPEKTFVPFRLDLEGDQRLAYQELAQDLVTEVKDKQVTAAVLVTKLIKLREITAGFVKTDDGSIRRFTDQAKLKALQELVEDLPLANKLVIWCQFHEELEMVEDLLKDLYYKEPKQSETPWVVLSGETPLSHRGLLVKQFQEDSRTRFFLGQQKAGGMGITLTAASHCVFMTNDYSPETRLQAEDRLHRIGQTNSVTYYDLLCKGTIDVTVMAALRKKQRLADLLTGDSFRDVIQGKDLL